MRTERESHWWDVALPITSWLSIAAWLAIAGFVIVFVVGSDWGVLLSLAGLVLAFGALCD